MLRECNMNHIALEKNNWIGQRTPRPDGIEKVTGSAQYSADFTMPGMVWGKVLRSPHAPALPPHPMHDSLRQSIFSGDNPILLYFGLLVIFFQRAPDLPTANEYTGLDLTRQIAAASAFLFMLLTLLPCPVELVYPAVPL